MSRRDIPDSVIHISDTTIETCFPTRGDWHHAAQDLSRYKVTISRLGTHARRSITGIARIVAVPAGVDIPAEDGWGGSTPLGNGGDVIVPVWHASASDWPRPPIPIIDGEAAAPNLYGARDTLLTYPVFRVDAGMLCVRWDRYIHELPAGRYLAAFYTDGILCGTFELDKKTCCDVNITQATSIEITQPDDLPPAPTGVTDMFDAIATWASTTKCTLQPGDTEIEVEDAGSLCSTTFCKAPELVLHDGVTTEVVEFLGCVNGKLHVRRTGTGTLQGGALIRFEWTPNNVTHAVEGC